MKTLILGDIHGRTWWKDIVERENPDKTIFLGDYVSTHDNISGQQQIDNFIEILNYKKSCPDKVVLLRGNHDIQHLTHDTGCCGFFSDVAKWMTDHKTDYFDNTQWIYVDNNVVFSHAGISKVWMDNCGFESLNEINECNMLRLFEFTPNRFSDHYGESVTQPCTWIRPSTLIRCAVDGYDQVVGHTTMYHIVDLFEYKNEPGNNLKNHLWMCDTQLQEYLVIEDGNYIVKKF